MQYVQVAFHAIIRVCAQNIPGAHDLGTTRKTMVIGQNDSFLNEQPIKTTIKNITTTKPQDNRYFLTLPSFGCSNFYPGFEKMLMYGMFTYITIKITQM